MNDTIASGPIDPTQPTNTNPTSGGFTFGTATSWLNAAAAGTGTFLGALNNKSLSSPAAKGASAPAKISFGSWIAIGVGALILLVVILLFHKK